MTAAVDRGTSSTSQDAPAVAGGWRHVPTHTGLLAPVVARPAGPQPLVPPAPRIDLAVVPTCRPDPARRHGLGTAVELARQGCLRRLLVLCSKDAAGQEAQESLHAYLRAGLPEGFPVAVTVLTGGPGAVPSFAADRLPLTSAYRRYARGNVTSFRSINEVGHKRNLALLLAARLKLRHVLFLDDDVRPTDTRGTPQDADVQDGPAGRTLDRASLSAALSAITVQGLAAVGWTLAGYHDNSVVCRVRRLVGQAQGQFIGGGALLVGLPQELPFFPAIYNEDWLFLLGAVDRGSPLSAGLGWGGRMLQDAYDGFLPRRARSEELGDILGEGLMSLAHSPDGIADQAMSAQFWREVLGGRRAMIEGLIADLTSRSLPSGSAGTGSRPVVTATDRDRALAALDAALSVHQQIGTRRAFWVDQFLRYVSAWQADLDQWRAHLDKGSYDDNRDLLPASTTFALGNDYRTAFGV